MSRFVSLCLTYITLINFFSLSSSTKKHGLSGMQVQNIKIMIMKSPNTTKNNFTESATLGRSTCTFKLNYVKFFAKHECVHFRIYYSETFIKRTPSGPSQVST